MFKRLLIAVATLLGAGCGGPSFSGTYTGTVTESAQCDNFTTPMRSTDVTLVVTESGDVLSWSAPLRDCLETGTANVSGDTASVNERVCGTPGSVLTRVQSGSLQLNGTTLTLRILSVQSSMSGSTLVTCNIGTTATLTRQGP